MDQNNPQPPAQPGETPEAAVEVASSAAAEVTPDPGVEGTPAAGGEPVDAVQDAVALLGSTPGYHVLVPDTAGSDIDDAKGYLEANDFTVTKNVDGELPQPLAGNNAEVLSKVDQLRTLMCRLPDHLQGQAGELISRITQALS